MFSSKVIDELCKDSPGFFVIKLNNIEDNEETRGYFASNMSARLIINTMHHYPKVAVELLKNTIIESPDCVSTITINNKAEDGDLILLIEFVVAAYSTHEVREIIKGNEALISEIQAVIDRIKFKSLRALKALIKNEVFFTDFQGGNLVSLDEMEVCLPSNEKLMPLDFKGCPWSINFIKEADVIAQIIKQYKDFWLYALKNYSAISAIRNKKSALTIACSIINNRYQHMGFYELEGLPQLFSCYRDLLVSCAYKLSWSYMHDSLVQLPILTLLNDDALCGLLSDEEFPSGLLVKKAVKYPTKEIIGILDCTSSELNSVSPDTLAKLGLLVKFVRKIKKKGLKHRSAVDKSLIEYHLGQISQSTQNIVENLSKESVFTQENYIQISKTIGFLCASQQLIEQTRYMLYLHMVHHSDESVVIPLLNEYKTDRPTLAKFLLAKFSKMNGQNKLAIITYSRLLDQNNLTTDMRDQVRFEVGELFLLGYAQEEIDFDVSDLDEPVVQAIVAFQYFCGNGYHQAKHLQRRVILRLNGATVCKKFPKKYTEKLTLDMPKDTLLAFSKYYLAKDGHDALRYQFIRRSGLLNLMPVSRLLEDEAACGVFLKNKVVCSEHLPTEALIIILKYTFSELNRVSPDILAKLGLLAKFIMKIQKNGLKRRSVAEKSLIEKCLDQSFQSAKNIVENLSKERWFTQEHYIQISEIIGFLCASKQLIRETRYKLYEHMVLYSDESVVIPLLNEYNTHRPIAATFLLGKFYKMNDEFKLATDIYLDLLDQDNLATDTRNQVRFEVGELFFLGDAQEKIDFDVSDLDESVVRAIVAFQYCCGNNYYPAMDLKNKVVQQLNGATVFQEFTEEDTEELTLDMPKKTLLAFSKYYLGKRGNDSVEYQFIRIIANMAEKLCTDEPDNDKDNDNNNNNPRDNKGPKFFSV